MGSEYTSIEGPGYLHIRNTKTGADRVSITPNGIVTEDLTVKGSLIGIQANPPLHYDPEEKLLTCDGYIVTEGAFNVLAPLDANTETNTLRIKNADGNTVTAITDDGTLTDNSATLLATQKAVKTYVDAFAATTPLLITPSTRTMSIVNDASPATTITTVSTIPTLIDVADVTASDRIIPTQKAVKTYVDSKIHSFSAATPLYVVSNTLGMYNVPGNRITAISDDTTLGGTASAHTSLATQKAVKDYVDLAISTGEVPSGTLVNINVCPMQILQNLKPKGGDTGGWRNCSECKAVLIEPVYETRSIAWELGDGLSNAIFSIFQVPKTITTDPAYYVTFKAMFIHEYGNDDHSTISFYIRMTGFIGYEYWCYVYHFTHDMSGLNTQPRVQLSYDIPISDFHSTEEISIEFGIRKKIDGYPKKDMWVNNIYLVVPCSSIIGNLA